VFEPVEPKVLPFQYRAMLKVLRALLRRRPDLQPAFFRALAFSLLNVGREAAINAFAQVFGSAELTSSQRDMLVRTSMLTADQDAALDAFSRVLGSIELTSAQTDKLLRASLGAYIGKEMPQQIFNSIEEISGASLHFSQEGEDVLLARILPRDIAGFFVDIGAHHPIRFSNTYSLYRNGWRGINVDATPDCMKEFEKLRPKDINIECAISDTDSPMTFYLFKEGALNTFGASLAKEYIDNGWMLERTITIQPRPLSSILDEHLPAGRHIDLLNIDVEGEEMGVLRSNDWRSYRPSLILLEVLATPFGTLKSHPAISFLQDKGYQLASRLANTVLMRNQS